MIVSLQEHDLRLSELVNLATEIWREHYESIIGQEQVDYMLEKFQSAKAIAEQMRDGYQYFLIYRETMLVGYFSFKPTAECLFLSKFYVKKLERGHGHGRRVIHFLCDQAKSFSLSKIQLTVNKKNAASLAAYDHLGFQNIRSVVNDIGHGYVMDDFVLELPVATPASTAISDLIFSEQAIHQT